MAARSKRRKKPVIEPMSINMKKQVNSDLDGVIQDSPKSPTIINPTDGNNRSPELSDDLPPPPSAAKK